MKLLVTYPDGGNRNIEFTGGKLLVGRNIDCDVVLGERNVSREHAEFFYDPTGALCVRDVGSRYGTRLNNELIIDAIPFSEGDILEVGDFAIEIAGNTKPTSQTTKRNMALADTKPIMIPGLEDTTIGGIPEPNRKHFFWIMLLLLSTITALAILFAGDFITG